MTISKYLTSPDIALEYFKRKVSEGHVFIASHRSVDAWLRQSIQGGKVFPQKGCFYSRDRKKILYLVSEQKRLKRLIESFPAESGGRKYLLKVRMKLALYHKFCQDYLHNLDITSLYPAEMAQREFPD